MNVNTLEVDSDTRVATREVSFDHKSFHTPAVATVTGKLRGPDQITALARGVEELYVRAGSAKLENRRRGDEKLEENYRRQARWVDDDDVVFPFFDYPEGDDLKLEHAKEIAKLQTNVGEILPSPTFSDLVDAADDGDGRQSSHVTQLLDNVRIYLQAVDELEISKPVMGMIPAISADCTLALLDIYRMYDIRAFVIDLNRRSPMAVAQVDHVFDPLTQALTDYDIRDESYVYALNAVYYRRSDRNRRPADSIMALTLGVDILGGNHIGRSMPESVVEKISRERSQGEIELRLIDDDPLSVVEVPLSGLETFLPSQSEIPVNRVKSRIKSNPDEKYRYEKLINSELLGIYLNSHGGIKPSDILPMIEASEFTRDEVDRIKEFARRSR